MAEKTTKTRREKEEVQTIPEEDLSERELSRQMASTSASSAASPEKNAKLQEVELLVERRLKEEEEKRDSKFFMWMEKISEQFGRAMQEGLRQQTMESRRTMEEMVETRVVAAEDKLRMKIDTKVGVLQDTVGKVLDATAATQVGKMTNPINTNMGGKTSGDPSTEEGKHGKPGVMDVKSEKR
jgi:hypothetical protein